MTSTTQPAANRSRDNFGDIQTNLLYFWIRVFRDKSLERESAGSIINSENCRGWFIEPAGYLMVHELMNDLHDYQIIRSIRRAFIFRTTMDHV